MHVSVVATSWQCNGGRTSTSLFCSVGVVVVGMSVPGVIAALMLWVRGGAVPERLARRWRRSLPMGNAELPLCIPLIRMSMGPHLVHIVKH